jgi:hypothetical protein
MRRILILAVLAAFSSMANAATDRQLSDNTVMQRSATSWVKRANVSAQALRNVQTDALALAQNAGPRPLALIETNYYTFLPGEGVQVRLTVQPNGYAAPVTMYLYRENRTTGDRRFYSVNGGLLAAGQQSDLFGSPASTPVAVFVPTLNDFVLFGAASDTSGISWATNGALGGSFTVPANDAGLWQWVIELRDAAGERVIARSNAMYAHVASSVNVTGTITASTTWTANNRYVLNDYVGVVAPATLTIEPGTVIYGGDGRATLFVQRGARIVADGTARRPIIFTSPQRTGSRAQRDWGSLVVLGGAPINVPGGQAFMEGLPSETGYSYGGTNPSDSSGVLRYVRLEFGGFEIATGQEINGLTLAGVGNGTVVDHIEVLQNKDDAFEFFGGTVNAKHLLGVGFADDGLDFDNGHSGSVQFVALIRRAGNDEDDANFFETDNHLNSFTLTPFTNPQVYNVTGVREPGTRGNYGMVIRRGSGGGFYNVLLTDARRAPVTMRDDATFAHATAGELRIDNSILFGDFSAAGFPGSSDRGDATRNFVFTTMTRNRNVDPMLAIGTPSLTDTLMPDLMPREGSPALDRSYVANPPDNGFLEQVDFIGAVGPGHDWILSGWASFSDN